MMTSTTNDVRILIVDDEPSVRRSLQDWLSEEGYHADVAASGKEVLQKLSSESWDVLLVDIKMPGMDGLELQRRVREAHPQATIIIMTAYASVETAVEAMKQGAYEYIVKPFEPSQLEHILRNALERRRLISENARLRGEGEERNPILGIIGTSRAMRQVLDEVRMVSQSDTNVLVRGESGTGKELIGRAVHASSRRRFMPIVVVNCGALSEGVMESELFGHEKGSFTGAHYQRKGKFELADGGTLFLDEIGDVSMKTQVDLLRVLDEKRVTRVGGNAPIAVDFRLIAATNRDLEALLRAGEFREDLYYRINVFSITVPPLRERREDIPLLLDHFIEKYAKSMNKPVSSLSDEALAALTRYDWPGNVRELQNAIERAVIVCKGSRIELSDLAVRAAAPGREADGDMSLSAMEKVHIVKVLEETEWNISRAARVLGIDRVTLYNKLKKYGLRQQGDS